MSALAETQSAGRGPSSPSIKKVSEESTVPRGPELTLANLRPGRDGMARAERLFSRPTSLGDSGSSRIWQDSCAKETLSVITDTEGVILQVTVAKRGGSEVPGVDSSKDCRAEARNTHWITGHGLVIGDSSDRVLALYGQPGTRGPSTKGGQKLELFYYAFDWAGPDVPQVMTVLCTPGNDEKRGRVVEITLAAPSL